MPPYQFAGRMAGAHRAAFGIVPVTLTAQLRSFVLEEHVERLHTSFDDQLT